jgi:hypothetical protein
VIIVRTVLNEVFDAMSHFPHMITKSMQAALLVGLAAFGHPKAAPNPNVPDKIKASTDEVVVLRARASGSQIYVCQQGAGDKPAWTLKAPEAELQDQHGAAIGRHYAGPTWKLNDGSEVTGKVVARVDSPDTDSIPWLLLTATGHSGHGALTHVSTIQRVKTKGGQPPPEGNCRASKLNSEVKSSYVADYYFYVPAKQPDWPD